MIRDANRVTDGFASLERGVDSGKNPSLLPRNQAAWGENVTMRGGYISPRPGWKRIPLVSSAATTALAVAKFQGADFFDDSTGRKGLLMVVAGGSLYRLELKTAGAVVTNVDAADGANSNVLQQAWTVQAENYFITQDGQSLPVIYNGITTRRATGTEVPIGSGPMSYGMLRLWVAKGNAYVAGDVAGGPTGVLSFTENDYIAEGGEFSLPLAAGNISAMRFTATPNTSLGQGELLLFTPRAVFSNTAPVDRDAWKNLTQPIQTITIINQGAQSQASTVMVNSDVFMRSTDGIRTVIQAVRNFMANQWGNTPLSNEVKRVLDKDTQSLLPFASAVEFDNRLLMTCQPVPIPNGCYHTGLVALDFDLVTSMGDKLPPAYDGLWTGPNIYRMVKGRFDGVERCFALCRSETDGFVWNIILTAAGTGYTSVPVVSFSGGGGTGAAASAKMKALSLATVDAGGWKTYAAVLSWIGIACSSDGTKVVACAYGNKIHTSTDSGVTWTPRDSIRTWYYCASSADGSKLVATVENGQIYTSTDSGFTWTARESVRTWYGVASSSDGSKLVALAYGGQIYTSTDSGVTWTARDSARNWYFCASSADGVNLVATVIGGKIYTSSNSGVSWTARDSNRQWLDCASSSDGVKLFAVVAGGQIYTSTDSGFTWTARDSARNWIGAASSADGVKLVATVDGGQIYTSDDSGVTWTAEHSTGNWIAVASSPDGNHLFATNRFLALARNNRYSAGDILTVTGGTSTIQTQIVVTAATAGAILSASVIIPGSYSALPSNPVSVSGVVGATFTLVWGVGSVVITNAGTLYTSAPVVAFSAAGGSGAAAVAVMEYRMELWELTKTGKFDYGLTAAGAPVETRVSWLVETPSYGFNTDRSNPATLKRLETGDLWMDRVTGTVDMTIHYRPDQYPCWNPWYAWQVCAKKCVEIDTAGCVVTAPEEQYRPRMILPQPPELAESVVAKSMRTGYEFSARLAGTGFVRIKLLRMHAKELVETVANPVAEASEPCAAIACACD